MEFSEYQQQALRTDINAAGGEVEPFAIPILGLAGEVGTLSAIYKKIRRDGTSYASYLDNFREEIGDVLWYTANLASKLGLSLDDIARLNLVKTLDRWLGEGSTEYELLDEDAPVEQQFPRKLKIDFAMVDIDGREKAVMQVDGAALGDPLTDNAYYDDAYRFHDAFHLAYAAVLGWSPVIRMLMRRKRKYDGDKDEVEDGGRAVAIEEGVAAFVFTYLERNNYLEGTDRVDGEILKHVLAMVSHLEVGARSMHDWEVAIREGAKIWRALRDHGGGTVVMDLDVRTIDFVAP